MSEVLTGLMIAVIWFALVVIIVMFNCGASEPRSASETLKDKRENESSN